MAIGRAWAEGSWVDASWVVGAWAADGVQTIGDTSQLEALSSTGGLDVQTNHTVGGTSQLEAFASTGTLEVVTSHDIGGTSQLEAFDSTGGITVELPKTIGGISQLEAFTSTGYIDSGEPKSGGQRGPVTTYPKKRKKAKKKEDDYYTSEAFLKKVQSGKIELNGVEVFLDEPIKTPSLDLKRVEVDKIKDEVVREIAQIMRKREEVVYEIEKTKYLQEIKKLEEQALFVMFVLLEDDF